MADDLSETSAVSRRFEEIPAPASRAIFRNLQGWRFDDGVWQSPEQTNRNFELPPSWNLDLLGIPRDFFQSGILGGDDLVLDEIRLEDQIFSRFWTPGIMPGRFFVHNSPETLHGTESLLSAVGDEIDENGLVYLNDVLDENSIRSQFNLERLALTGTPYSVEYLQREDNLGISPYRQFRQVALFKGLAYNGVEQDGSFYANTDKSVDEFLVETDDDREISEIRIIDGENLTVAAGIGRLALEGSPVYGKRVRFSREDIFRRELTFTEWHATAANPATPLSQGDYAIGYLDGTGQSTGVWICLSAETYLDYGAVSYVQAYAGRLLFNKDVRISALDIYETDVPAVTITKRIASEDGLRAYLPIFPLLDRSSFENSRLLGGVDLDVTTTKVYVDGDPWTRVLSINEVEEGDDQNVFELDPLNGVVRFGNGGNSETNPVWGSRPDGAIAVDWTIVPSVRYTLRDGLFWDDRCDLDPLANGLKHGFLVLDNRRPVAARIVLSTTASRTEIDDKIIFGKLVDGETVPLEIPPSSTDDIFYLKAQVFAYGSNTEGVPNIPVRFSVKKGAPLNFVQQEGVTDGEGNVYTEVFGKSNFSQYCMKMNVYAATENEVLNPDPATLLPMFLPGSPLITDHDASEEAAWEGLGPSWTDNAILVEDFVSTETDLEAIFMFIVSVPGANNLADYNDTPLAPELYPEPYSSKTRDGGLSLVWSFEEDDSQKIAHPCKIVQLGGDSALIVFNRKIPLSGGNLIVGYKIVIDRTSVVEAITLIEPILRSNTLTFLSTLNDSMRGQWKLPSLDAPDSDGFQEDPEEENFDSSRISTAIYLSPNDVLVSHLWDAGGVETTDFSAGQVVRIIGENFPITDELRVSVYIVKLDLEERISAVKDITAATVLVSSTEMMIASIPAPPTGLPGNYYIAVSSVSASTKTPIVFLG